MNIQDYGDYKVVVEDGVYKYVKIEANGEELVLTESKELIEGLEKLPIEKGFNFMEELKNI